MSDTASNLNVPSSPEGNEAAPAEPRAAAARNDTTAFWWYGSTGEHDASPLDTWTDDPDDAVLADL